MPHNKRIVQPTKRKTLLDKQQRLHQNSKSAFRYFSVSQLYGDMSNGTDMWSTRILLLCTPKFLFLVTALKHFQFETKTITTTMTMFMTAMVSMIKKPTM